MKIMGGNNSGITMRGYTTSDLDFTINYLLYDILVSGSSIVPITINDLEYMQSNPSITDHVARVICNPPLSQLPSGVELYSATPNIATINKDGNLNYVSSGLAIINIHGNHLTKQTKIPISRTADNITNTLVGYVSGSLSKYCSNTIDTLITGMNQAQATASLPIFSTYPTTSGDINAIYIRNTGYWLNSIIDKFTCVSPWNNKGGKCQAGTLVSPCHIVLAEHYSYPTGTAIRFVNTNNQVFTYIITAVNNVGVSNGIDEYETDICVAKLNQDIDNSITFAKILPTNWANYCPSLNYVYTIPALAINQNKQVMIHDMVLDGWITNGYAFTCPKDTTRSLFYKNLIGGDSGSPAFLLINGELVLVTTWTFGDGGSGPGYTEHKDAINTIMTAQGGGYQLTEIDLSNFNYYE